MTNFEAWAITLISEIEKIEQYLSNKKLLDQSEVEILINMRDLLIAWKLETQKEQKND